MCRFIALWFICLSVLINENLYAQKSDSENKIDSIVQVLTNEDGRIEGYQFVLNEILYNAEVSEEFRTILGDTIIHIARDSLSAYIAYRFANGLGQYFRYSGNYAKSLHYYNLASQIVWKWDLSEPPEYLNLGDLYIRVGDTNTGIKYYEVTLQFCEDSVSEDDPSKNNCLAWALIHLGRSKLFYEDDSGLVMIRKAINLWVEAGPENREWGAISYAYKELAQYFVHTREFKRALSMTDTIKYWANSENIIDDYRLSILTQCYLGLKQMDTALYWAKKYDSIVSFPDQSGRIHIDKMAWSKLTLAIIYSELGDFKKAYYAQKTGDSLQDILNSKKNMGVVAFEREKTNMAQLEREKEAQLNEERELKFYFGIGILILLIISSILFSSRQLIKKTNKELERAKVRAERSESAKQQFLANMSHEIRTPMNAILGMTNLVLDADLADKERQYLEAVKKSTENLLVIINDILDLSKLEIGKMNIEFIAFNLKDQLRIMHETLHFKAEEKAIDFKLDIDSEVPEFIKGDPYRLNQILLNLCGNAIKFTENGFVHLHVQVEEEMIRFSVKDSGIGISEVQRESLFSAFKQAESGTTRKYGGTGLGLTISKTLIEMQKGSIGVKSEKGQGSEFFFTLPFKAASEKDIADLLNERGPDVSNLKGIKLLLAEDNKFNQIVLHDTIKHLVEGAEVDLAENGKVAVEKIESNQYHIVLMDVNMPDMNGIEATKYVRKNLSEQSEIVILALTASVLNNDIEIFKKSGMNDYIPKPFTREELLTKLSKYYQA